MRWPKRRSKRPPVPEVTAGQAEAGRALDKAEAGLRQVRREEREILATAEKLRRLGESNDFAARIKQALGGT